MSTLLSAHDDLRSAEPICADLDSDVVVTLEELLRGVLAVSPDLVNVYSFSLCSAPLQLSTPTSFFLSHSIATLHIRLRVRGGTARLLQPKDASKTILRQYALTVRARLFPTQMTLTYYSKDLQREIYFVASNPA